MPRLISEIKDPKLRKLAELRREENKNINEYRLLCSFVWKRTKEEKDFWRDVYYDIITELPKDHPLYDEL